MAKRVAIIGGRKKGRDHFPFPVRDVANVTPAYNNVGDGRFRPQLLTLEQACNWCFRVKKWHFELTFDYEIATDVIDDDNYEYTSGSAELRFDYIHRWTPLVDGADDDDPDNNIVPAAESDLVRARFGGWTSSQWIASLRRDGSFIYDDGGNKDFELSEVSSSATFDDESGEDLVEISLSHEIFDSPIAGWTEAGLAPSIWFAMGFDQEVTTGYNETAFYGALSLANYCGTMTVTTLDTGDPDVSAPMQTNSEYLGSGGHQSIHFGNVVLAISAVEYWPFANKAGATVYNTTTGAELADPFS